MSRISGRAVWSNRPRTELARAPAEKLAGATLQYKQKLSLFGYISYLILVLELPELVELK